MFQGNVLRVRVLLVLLWRCSSSSSTMVHPSLPSTGDCTLYHLWFVCSWVERIVKSSISMALQICFGLFCSGNGYASSAVAFRPSWCTQKMVIAWPCTCGGGCRHAPKSYLFGFQSHFQDRCLFIFDFAFPGLAGSSF